MENYNPLPLKLAFDARGTTSQTINAPCEGTQTTLTIYSHRDTKVNGKVTDSDLIDFTTKLTSDGSISADSWISTKKAVNDALSYSLEIKLSPNLKGARTGTIILTQASSGKIITINISQAAGITVQEYVLTSTSLPNIDLMFLANGSTQTIEVKSYILYSDGSTVAKVPYVDSKPTWLTVKITPKSQDVSNTKYSVTLTATPNTGTTVRRDNLVLRQEAVEENKLTFVVSQEMEAEIEITLTNLPINGMGALFGEFEIPSSNSTSNYFVFSILGTSHKFTYKKSTGLIVNLSTPGTKGTAYIGDVVRVYTWNSNSNRWVYRTKFALPSSNTTIPVE